MSTSKKIALTTDLNTFFCGEIDAISRKQGLSLQQLTRDYLGQMLASFHKSDAYFVKPRDPSDKRQEFPTISLLWLEGLSAEYKERLQAMKKVGDLALFTTGFFPERLQRRMVDMDYFMAIGERAYETAAHMRETHFTERAMNCFFELSEKFGALTEILREISDRQLLGSEADQLLLYEKWLQSNNQRIQRMLGEVGILVSTSRDSKS